MKLLVYLKDGRTVYYIEGRGKLRALTMKNPGHEDESVTVVKGTWQSGTGEYEWHRNLRVRFIAPGSISHVEEGHPTEAAGGQE